MRFNILNLNFATTNCFKAWLILILIALMATNLNLQFPCLMTIKNDLQTSDFIIQLSLIIGPALAILCNILMGIWGMVYSRKTLLLTCIILFYLGSLICGIASCMELFMLGRLFQVLGDSGLSIIGFVILKDLSNDKKFGEYLGYNTILSTILSICAPPTGAFILIHYGWRINFLLLSLVSFVLLILFYFVIKNNDDKADNLHLTKISVSDLFRQYLILLKSPFFTLSILIPALYATTSSLFDFYSPVFYMDIHRLTPEIFSYVKILLILVSIIASLIYIYVLKKRGSDKAFYIGLVGHFFYSIIIILVLLTHNYNQPYLFFILAALQIISADFINPVSMLRAVACFPKKENISLSLFALARNIVSTLITLTAALIFYGNIYPVIIIMLLIALSLCYFLLSVKK